MFNKNVQQLCLTFLLIGKFKAKIFLTNGDFYQILKKIAILSLPRNLSIFPTDYLFNYEIHYLLSNHFIPVFF